MTGFRQRQNRSILTAPGARGLSPHSLVQPDSRLSLPSGHGKFIQLKNKKGFDAFQIKEHHHNHSKATF